MAAIICDTVSTLTWEESVVCSVCSLDGRRFFVVVVGSELRWKRKERVDRLCLRLPTLAPDTGSLSLSRFQILTTLTLLKR